MGKSAIDLHGHRFGRLIVVARAANTRDGKAQWLCLCDCGKTAVIRSITLIRSTQSCGCLAKEVTSRRARRHGHAKHGKQSREYRAWCAAKDRCSNPKAQAFINYGGRGITMCESWLNSFEMFFKDMGECPPGFTLDRFPDNDGNYEPNNCRWATYKEQANNRRPARRIKKVHIFHAAP